MRCKIIQRDLPLSLYLEKNSNNKSHNQSTEENLILNTQNKVVVNNNNNHHHQNSVEENQPQLQISRSKSRDSGFGGN